MQNSFRVVIIFIAIALSSLLCIPKLNVDLLPKSQSKQLNISFFVNGASPEQTEQEATSVLENSFSQLKNLKGIRSYSGYNYGVIQLYFDKDQDMEFRKFETVSIIRHIKSFLPDNVSYPTVSQNEDGQNQSSTPLLIYTLNSKDANYKIKQTAEEYIKKSISVISGIKDIEISGVQGKQLTIEYDLDKLRAYHLSSQDIILSLNRENKTLYPGSVKISQNEVAFIKVNAPKGSIESLKQIQVTNNNNTTSIKLGDLANIYTEDQIIQTYFRINGKNAVNVSIYSSAGVNTISLSKEIETRIKKLTKSLPSGYELSLTFDDTVYLKKEIAKNYQRTILALLILLAFIFLTYKNWKHVLNLFLSLIINLSFVVLFTWYFKISIHIYTLAGIAIAFGIMIDHAIIMIDYYSQYNNKKVLRALLGATLTTTAALSLVFFLPEQQKANLSDFALIIIISLLTSLITNFFFTTSLQDLLFKGERQVSVKKIYKTRRLQVLKRQVYLKIISVLGKNKKVFVLNLILLFGIPLFMLPENWEGKSWYNKSVGSKFYQEEIAPSLNVWLGGTFRLFKVNIYEKSEYRDLSQTILYVKADLPVGNTLEQMNLIVQGMENYLARLNGVEKFITDIYSGQSALIAITFKEDADKGNLPYQIKTQLTTKALDWGGVNWRIYGVGQGFSNAGMEEVPNFRVKFKGYNYDEVARQSNRLKDILSTHKRVQKINPDDRINFGDKAGQEYVLNISSRQAALAGTSPNELFDALSPMALKTNFDQNLIFDNKIYPVAIKSINSTNFSKWDVMNGITLIKDKYYKVVNFSEMSLEKTSGSIIKENRQYIKILSFEYFGSSEFGKKFLNKKLKELGKTLPVGYSATQDDFIYDPKKDGDQYYLLILLFVMNFFICSILFENLIQPLIIIATIPVSFVGLFIVFFSFSFPFDQGGYAAFIMLGGLVVNAGIFILNDFNNLLVSKVRQSHNKLLVKATANRSRTIILTTIAAICGMIPFLMDGKNEPFWFPLAVGTIGGLIFSMFAIFLVLPVMMWSKKDLSLIDNKI